MLRLVSLAFSALLLVTAQVATAQAATTQAANPQQASPTYSLDSAYRLGAGDKLRITVFNEDTLSGEYEVDGSGVLALKLLGIIPAGGRTVPEVTKSIEDKLKEGYLLNPSVAIEVLNYRPFYVLGEVKEPGKYAYVTGMSVLNAVALAGGYTYRAKQRRVLVIRANDPQKKEEVADQNTVIMPGDIIRVPERFF
jgi:protein involved in polysaccharide export with SLBB domain